MTDDLIERAEKALEGYHRDHRAFGAEIARDSLGLSACDLLPEAIEEIKRLEAKANQMVADKINLRSELISVQAKLAVAVEAGVDVAASLNAAISLLERGGKKAAPSDKMFAQILVDYSASLDRFRTTLAELTGGKDE